MKLNYDKKSKDPTYFVQIGIRNGKKVTTKNIERIGKHSELLAVTDDPLQYAKDYVAKLNVDSKKQKDEMSISILIDLSKKIAYSNSNISKSKVTNIGYIYLQSIYKQLGLAEFFETITDKKKIKYDSNQINRFLTFSRILYPGSKLDTCEHLDRFYETPDFTHDSVLRFMDILADNYDSYIEQLFNASNIIVKRNTSICYYDCTNFYFETEEADEDYVDEVTGELVNTLRHYGISKEHRPNPIVEMGLFIDGNGIPISMCIHPGNTNEQTTAIPLEKKLVKMFNGKSFIYCADGGLNSVSIRQFNSMGGRSFVVTQSLKKCSTEIKNIVFTDENYKWLEDNAAITIASLKEFDKKREENRKLYDGFAYKMIPIDKLVDIGLTKDKVRQDGSSQSVKDKATLKQTLLVSFSRKKYEYDVAIRTKQIERARHLIQSRDPELIKKGPNDVTRFLRRTSTTKDGVEATIDTYIIDQSVIDEEAKYDGYYAIVTNLEDDAATIMNINKQRYMIEDCFKVIKTNFSGRPVYHHLDSRIKAHFLICFTALLLYRVLDNLLEAKNYHFTINEIIESLQNMNVINSNDLYYESTYTGSKLMDALNDTLGMEINKQYYLPKELNKKFQKYLK